MRDFQCFTTFSVLFFLSHMVHLHTFLQSLEGWLDASQHRKMTTITQTITEYERLLSNENKLYPTISSLITSKEAEEDENANTPVKTERLPDIPLPPPSKVPTEILSIDKNTPDHHVPRDPRLIRLTGVHPFNVEPPLTPLFNEGKNCHSIRLWLWHLENRGWP